MLGRFYASFIRRAQLAGALFPRDVFPSSCLLLLLAACGADTTAPEPPLQFASVRAGTFRTCGLTTAGAAYCWGGSDSTISTTPRAVSGSSGLGFATLDIAANYACGVTAGSLAYCWGGRFSNAGGALGIGSTDTSAHMTPQAVVGGHAFASVSTGGSHTCGLTTTGAVYCWGSNEFGRLGDGTMTASSVPVVVAGGHTFRFVSAGETNACAVTIDDDAYCWGAGTQLGDGTTEQAPGSPFPVLVSGGHKFASLSVGEQATCGVTTDGAAYCWGMYDNLGGGAMTTRSTPARVAVGLTLAAISVSSFHICGVTTGGAAYCWGFNGNGQLGNGTTAESLTPVLVSGGLTFTSISAGTFHTCGMTTDSVAYCWGSGFVGALGDGSTTDRTTPVRVSGQQ